MVARSVHLAEQPDLQTLWTCTRCSCCAGRYTNSCAFWCNICQGHCRCLSMIGGGSGRGGADSWGCCAVESCRQYEVLCMVLLLTGAPLWSLVGSPYESWTNHHVTVNKFAFRHPHKRSILSIKLNNFRLNRSYIAVGSSLRSPALMKYGIQVLRVHPLSWFFV